MNEATAPSEKQPALTTTVTAQVVKKSRFSCSLTNVIQEQNRFKEQQQQQPQQSKPDVVNTEATNTTKKDNGSEICNEDKNDIVYDINKWPDSLKAYCAKVYKHYSQNGQVSEDQVTKYLQKKIIDAFKVTPDLNTGWETEPIPEIYDIKQVRTSSSERAWDLIFSLLIMLNY